RQHRAHDEGPPGPGLDDLALRDALDEARPAPRQQHAEGAEGVHGQGFHSLPAQLAAPVLDEGAVRGEEAATDLQDLAGGDPAGQRHRGEALRPPQLQARRGASEAQLHLRVPARDGGALDVHADRVRVVDGGDGGVHQPVAVQLGEELEEAVVVAPRGHEVDDRAAGAAGPRQALA
ncbi:MAG: hypothetical protein ACK559_17835, partial [bacterium]